MHDFDERINLSIPLEMLSKQICLTYELGEFIDNKVIEIGYEDYNYILITSVGKYVVKVFSKHRTNEDCKSLADRGTVPFDKGISCPKIYKVNGNNLTIIKLQNVEYRLIVMEYIDGDNFFILDQLPNNHELEQIGVELAKLNQIEFNLPFIYDKWTIVNYEKEYNQFGYLVENEYKKYIDIAFEKFKSCDLTKLKYGFVHGDIIETNVIKSKNGKLYFIDFSVSNFLPKIVDLAITICDLCLDLENMEISKQRTKILVDAYQTINQLTKYEIECLKNFIVCHQAITIIETTREKVLENNQTEENEKFLEKGKKGIKLVLENNLLELIES